MIFVVFYLYQPVKKTFMKINRKLIAAFACLSVVFGACTQNDSKVDAGVDANAAGPNVVTYDEDGSSSSTLAVYWDAAPAINAGATSFTVQLLKNLEDTPDSYDASVSQTLLVNSNYVGSPAVQEGHKVACDQAVFANLAKGKIYYVRVRANYPMSKMSKWVLCADEAGLPARIKVGKGLIGEDEIEDKTAPTAKMVDGRTTAADAIVTWSTFNWANNNADFGMAYSLTLKKGNELVVKWNLPADGSAAGIWKYAKKGCRWIFTGLDADTEYTVLVENTTDGVSADPVTFKTKASQVVTLPTAPAAAGDIILYEDFANLIITGDYASYASGYSYDNRNVMDSTWKATGDDPVKNDDGTRGCYLVDASTEVGMFNTIKGLVATTRLADWGMMAEDDTKGAICARTGYVKMGASSKCAWLCTPELTCLAQPAQVELSFDAALYDSDPRTAIIEVLGGTTIEVNNNRFVRPSTRFTAAQFEVGSEAGAWAHYTFVIDGVMPGNRIAIGGDRNGVDGQHRFYLDNICVKVLSYGKLTLNAPENLVLTATDKTIDAAWDAVANTKAYVVEYKAKSAAEWTALPAVAETNVTIEGLAFETEYEVRVKATADDVESEYSAVAAIKTLAEIKKLGTPVISETFGGVGFAFVTIAPVTNATAYEVYSGETKLEAVVALESAEQIILSVGNLGFEKAYTLKVKAVAEGVESSDFSNEVSGTTGKIWQNTDNVGPTTLSISWTDLKEGTNDVRAYGVQVATDAAMTNLVYDIYCRDGQGASGVTSYGATSWYGKAGGSNLAAPTAATFGQLAPETTYYIRVKTVHLGDVATNGVKMKFPYGTSAWSDVVSYKTEAKHVAAANEVLFQGFDDVTLQTDFINYAAGSTPLVSDKKACAFPHNFVTEENWCMYPATTSHKLTTWGISEAAPFVDGTEGYCMNGSTLLPNRTAGDKIPSIKGWNHSEEVSPHQGYIKVGTGSSQNQYVATPALESSLLAAAGTPCVIKFKACATTSDTGDVSVDVFSAGTPTEVGKVNLPHAGEYTDGSNYLYDGKWIEFSIDATIKPGDCVVFRSGNKLRFVIDDIQIVTK